MWHQKSAIDKRACARVVHDAGGVAKRLNGCPDFLMDLFQDASS